MRYWKLTGCMRQISRILCLLLFALLAMTGAQAQLTQVTQNIKPSSSTTRAFSTTRSLTRREGAASGGREFPARSR